MKTEEKVKMEKMIDEIRSELFDAAKVLQNYSHYDNAEEADEMLENVIQASIEKLKEAKELAGV